LKRTIHRVAEEMTAETVEFLERSLATDPNSAAGDAERTLLLGPAGNWFMVVTVYPSRPSHPDDGIAWKIGVRGAGDAHRVNMTVEEAVEKVSNSVLFMLGDLEGKLEWMRTHKVEPQDILNDLTVMDVMGS
jgi:hypothetical protein